MSYTDQFLGEAYFGDLYELTIQDAAQKLHEGLWNENQASIEQIREALEDAIAKGELELVRGSLRKIGEYSTNPPILDANELGDWIEKNGLELESNGRWHDYMDDECTLVLALQERLGALRALQNEDMGVTALGGKVNNDLDLLKDKLIALTVENHMLSHELNTFRKDENHTPEKENPKSILSLLKIVIAMAVAGYRYDPRQTKSPIHSEIARDVERVGLSIVDDTTRHWLRRAAEMLPPDWDDAD